METNLLLIVIILAIILILVTILALIIGYFWASSKTKTLLLKQQEVAQKHAEDLLHKWKEQELSVIKQQIFDSAKGQATQEMQLHVEKWKAQELSEIKKQISDSAKGQATQEMQLQIQKWQENELEVIKKQISEAMRGASIKEAQEQLIKWRSDELVKTKSQIWEVLTKEAKVSLEQWKVEAEKEIRQDAINKSQSVTIGKMTEHIVPYLPGFRFNPADARFIGSPIDFVVFDGLGDGEVRKIVFVEIKTGASNLSSRERSVRNAVQDKNIEWLEIKVNLDDPQIIQEYRSRRINKKSE